MSLKFCGNTSISYSYPVEVWTSDGLMYVDEMCDIKVLRVRFRSTCRNQIRYS